MGHMELSKDTAEHWVWVLGGSTAQAVGTNVPQGQVELAPKESSAGSGRAGPFQCSVQREKHQSLFPTIWEVCSFHQCLLSALIPALLAFSPHFPRSSHHLNYNHKNKPIYGALLQNESINLKQAQGQILDILNGFVSAAAGAASHIPPESLR